MKTIFLCCSFVCSFAHVKKISLDLSWSRKSSCRALHGAWAIVSGFVCVLLKFSVCVRRQSNVSNDKKQKKNCYFSYLYSFFTFTTPKTYYFLCFFGFVLFSFLFCFSLCSMWLMKFIASSLFIWCENKS